MARRTAPPFDGPPPGQNLPSITGRSEADYLQDAVALEWFTRSMGGGGARIRDAWSSDRPAMRWARNLRRIAGALGPPWVDHVEAPGRIPDRVPLREAVGARALRHVAT